jgi:hypothetical protein
MVIVGAEMVIVHTEMVIVGAEMVIVHTEMVIVRSVHLCYYWCFPALKTFF